MLLKIKFDILCQLGKSNLFMLNLVILGYIWDKPNYTKLY
jgi:hypothetical protein